MAGQYAYVGGELATAVRAAIRDVPDFPKPGILFKDITPLLLQPAICTRVTAYWVERYRQRPIDAIVAVESRGFLFGAPLAYELKKPLALARKQGKLPAATVTQSYALEYGTAAIELHADALTRGQRVLIIDDLLATGGTVAATAQLVERQGAHVAECAFLIELGFLAGRAALEAYDVCSLVRYD
ncbi:MAG: adenine phosphoribosyltransferase [Deltaproteobacteria bacterium]|nr:adenine phosphoribosyltransferase [Deltaproteobacteria bacterium]